MTKETYKKCVRCNNLFYKRKSISWPNWETQKFCSIRCSALSRGKGWVTNVCPKCGKNYTVRRNELENGRFKTCSIGCGSRGRKMKNETKLKIRNAQLGELGNNWGGGRRKTNFGYIQIYKPNHPSVLGRTHKGKYVFEHRIVMEEKLKRFLKKNESVHHRNGVKDDNRIENLEIVLKNPHAGRVNCPFCEKEFLIR